jgi:hypothetical protein
MSTVDGTCSSAVSSTVVPKFADGEPRDRVVVARGKI